jgi:hypothetical protein
VQPFQARTFRVSMTLPRTGGEVVILDGALVGAGGLALAYLSRRKAA